MVNCEAFTEKDIKVLTIFGDRPDWRGLGRLWEPAIGDIGGPIRHGEVHEADERAGRLRAKLGNWKVSPWPACSAGARGPHRRVLGLHVAGPDVDGFPRRPRGGETLASFGTDRCSDALFSLQKAKS
jgi:hypothetical protein